MNLLLVAYICPIFRENKPDSAKKQSNSPEDSVETWDFILFSSDEISETSEKISKTSDKMKIYHENYSESALTGWKILPEDRVIVHEGKLALVETLKCGF